MKLSETVTIPLRESYLCADLDCPNHQHRPAPLPMLPLASRKPGADAGPEGEGGMTDEEYVRAHWGTDITAGADIYGYGITLPTRPPLSFTGFVGKKTAWAAAAEFTCERLEQIRQLEREILVLGNLVDMYARDAYRCINGTSSNLGRDLEGAWAMCAYTVSRSVARLESALADLRRGMKA